MPERIRIITDSAATLPHEVARRKQIDVVPLIVTFGNESFRDGIDIWMDKFLRLLKSSPTLPTTAAPSISAFKETYKRYSNDSILSVNLGSGFSAVYNNATLAAREIDSERIKTYDTGTVSMGIGFLAQHAANLAQQGATMEQIITELNDMKERLTVIAALDTLEYLEKGGRASKTQALFGNILQVKPIIRVDNNKISALEKPRTKKVALQRLVELTENWGHLEKVGVLHAGAPTEAQSVRDNINKFFPHEIFIGDIGAVLATHSGPGVVGVCAVRKK